MLEEAVAGNEAGGHVEAGRAALAAGEWEAARDAFHASIDDAPSAAGFEGLGVASRWLGEQETAMRALQRAYRLHRRAGDARSSSASASATSTPTWRSGSDGSSAPSDCSKGWSPGSSRAG